MPNDEILMEPLRGHPSAFRFTFTSNDGKITGQVSVALEGRPETRSAEEKMRAAQLKVEHLAHAFANAVSEKRYADRT
jgi:hypothetical protein